MQSGTDMVMLDSRPFDEFQRVSIPTAINVPGAELVLRVHDIAPSPETLVVVNCAGRTRSIIGAQSLINAGLPNKVVALRNGTMGWTLAGFTPRQRQDAARADVSHGGLAWAKAAAERVAKRFGITRIDARRWSASAPTTTRTLYLFDVRDPAEYAAGHVAGAISAPGGQLVQATDQYAGTLGARIVLVDEREVRAVMTASWLRQMGWRDVFVLVAAGNETGGRRRRCSAPRRRAELRIDAPAWPSCWRADAAPSSISRSAATTSRRHIPGAWFAIRARLAAGARQGSAARHAGAHVGGRRARRPRGARSRALTPRPLSRRRQRRLARRRLALTDRRSAHGRRADRHLAQALRASRRQHGRDARISVVGGRSPAAHRARRHHTFFRRLKAVQARFASINDTGSAELIRHLGNDGGFVEYYAFPLKHRPSTSIVGEEWKTFVQSTENLSHLAS